MYSTMLLTTIIYSIKSDKTVSYFPPLTYMYMSFMFIFHYNIIVLIRRNVRAKSVAPVNECDCNKILSLEFFSACETLNK